MPEQEHQAFYEDAIEHVIDRFIDLLGEKTALKYARQAPLQIDKDGSVTAFYGEGDEVLSILTDQYSEVFGRTVARGKVRSALADIVDEDDLDRVPDAIRPGSDETTHSFVERLRSFFHGR